MWLAAMPTPGSKEAKAPRRQMGGLWIWYLATDVAWCAVSRLCPTAMTGAGQ
jgi:hypothetical protein